MKPILFHLGSFPIRSYGVMMAVAFVVGILIARRRAKAAGLDPDIIVDLAFFMIVASIIGARGAYVIARWGDVYHADPAAVFRVWDGGLAQYGGIVLGAVTGILFFARRGIDAWKGADVVVPSLAVGIAIGRIGCFLNGCCFGRPCDLRWAVTFPPVSAAGHTYPGMPIHPTQLYAALAAIVMFFVLVAVERRKPFNGFLFWLFMILLAAYRFLIDPIRHYAAVSVAYRGPGLALTNNQVAGIFLIILAISFMIVLGRRGRRARSA